MYNCRIEGVPIWVFVSFFTALFKQINSVTLVRFLLDASTSVPCWVSLACFETIDDRLKVLHVLIDMDQLLVSDLLKC